MAQQTALEQLIEWIDSDCTPMDCVMKAKELLKVEKQQKKDAWDRGKYIGESFPQKQIEPEYEQDSEQYYTQTYTKKQQNKIPPPPPSRFLKEGKEPPKPKTYGKW
jgi:hypothetical protein